jgi:chromosome segregation ATPase
MAHEFRQLCPLANARGEITVIKSDEDVNDWGLEVRIGFDGKQRESLSSAPLSRGQEVLTSLYLVLAALRTVHATPILVLDELMSLLDERNAPKVLAGLKETRVQCFVATPQSRSGADEQADVLWGFSCKESHESLAPAIAVLVRRQA